MAGLPLLAKINQAGTSYDVPHTNLDPLSCSIDKAPGILLDENNILVQDNTSFSASPVLVTDNNRLSPSDSSLSGKILFPDKDTHHTS
jgi:hypothetical protein